MIAISSDGVRVHYELTGSGPTALVFAHGWLGNGAWWNAQRDYFVDRYTVVQVDLPTQGARRFADDIGAVCNQIEAPALVLVGHSMSGVFVVEAAPAIARTRAIILVDTLKDLDEVMTPEEAAEIVRLFRADFRAAILDVLPLYQFAATTPPEIRSRLQAEFLEHDPEVAIAIAAPLYTMDVRELARRVTVPVRAINSDYQPTHRDHNERYFRDYDVVEIAGTGHYPMLERPDELNRLLDEVLAGLPP